MNFKRHPFIALSFFAFLTFANAQTDVRRVREGDFYGFKNEKNEWLIEPKCEIFDSPFGDFMIAQNAQKLRGATNGKGDTLVPFEFQAIKPVQGNGFGEGKNRRIFGNFLAQKDGK